MADQGQGQDPGTEVSNNSGHHDPLKAERERQREERRRKILQGQGSRLNRILGVTEKNPPEARSTDHLCTVQDLKFGGFQGQSSSSSPKTEVKQLYNDFSPQEAREALRTIKGSTETPTSDPKYYSPKLHHLILVLMGFIIPLLGLSTPLVYFLILEASVLTFLRPVQEPPRGRLLSIIMIGLLILPERIGNKIKKVVVVLGLIWVDFVWFLFGVIVPQLFFTGVRRIVNAL